VHELVRDGHEVVIEAGASSPERPGRDPAPA